MSCPHSHAPLILLLTTLSVVLATSAPLAGPSLPGGAVPLVATPDGAGGMFSVASIGHDQYADLYIQYVSAAGTAHTTPAGWGFTTTADLSQPPLIVADGTGGVIVAWKDRGSAPGLYAQRYVAGGGRRWAQGGIAISTSLVGGSGATPCLMADGAGGAIVAWLDTRSDASGDVYAQRLDSSGVAQWGPTGLLVCGASGSQLAPAVVSDAAGGVFIAWTDYRNGNDDIFAQRVNGTGFFLWTTNGVAVCTASGGQSGVGMVADGASGAILAWHDQRNGGTGYDIYAQRLHSSGLTLWSSNGVAVCTATGDQEFPAIVGDGGTGAILAWKDRRNGTDRDLYAQRLNASGVTQWTTNGLAVCTAAGDQTSLALSADGAGGALLAWVDARTGPPRLYAQRLHGAGACLWAADGVAVSPAAVFMQASEPTILPYGSGGALLTWYDTPALDREMFTQALDATGGLVWPEAVGLFLDPGVQRNAAQISDGAGGAIVTWAEKRGHQYDICARRYDGAGAPLWPRVVLATTGGLQPMITADLAGGTIVSWFDERNGVDTDVYAQRLDGSGNTLWTAGGAPVCTAASYQMFGGMVADSAGGAVVAWTDWRNGAADIYAQRINSSGAPVWAANGVPVCTATGQQRFDRNFLDSPVVIGPGGGAFVAWKDSRGGAGTDLYAQRLDGSGAPQWTVNGIPVCTAAGEQGNFRVFGGRTLGLLLVWEDTRAGRTDIYAQRVTDAGVPQWTADGVLVETSTSDASRPDIFALSGNITLAWVESRPPYYDGDIVMQRLAGASGAPLWGPDGVTVCAASGLQWDPRIARGGSLGAFVVWEDHRAGPGSERVDIYAQRLDSSGVVSWTSDGVALCLASGSQLNPGIVYDGVGGAIVSWEDRRDGANDFLFFQRVDGTGAALWAPNGTTHVPTVRSDGSGLSLSAPWPNPAPGRWSFSLILPTAEPATLEVFDLAGRREWARDLAPGPPGARVVRVGDGVRFAPGVHLVRVRQGERWASARVVALR